MTHERHLWHPERAPERFDVFDERGQGVVATCRAFRISASTLVEVHDAKLSLHVRAGQHVEVLASLSRSAVKENHRRRLGWRVPTNAVEMPDAIKRHLVPPVAKSLGNRRWADRRARSGACRYAR